MVADPGESVTELDGIGKKTAEDLAEQGIRTVGDLAAEYERVGDYSFSSNRVASAARRAATDLNLEQSGSFADPTTGLTITDENRRAAEVLGYRQLGNISSVDTREARENVREVKGTETRLGSLVEPVRQGKLGEQGASQNLVGWAADAAANITGDELGSGGIQDLNRAAQVRSETVKTSPDQSHGLAGGKRTEFSIGGFTRAAAYDQRRSQRAQSMDDNRAAPVTTDYAEWRSDPAHHDYPGVDTREDVDTLFGEYKKKARHSMRTRTVENRDKGDLQEGMEFLSRLPPEAAERLTGDSRAYDVDPTIFF